MHFFRHMRVLRSQARRDDQRKGNRKTLIKKTTHAFCLFCICKCMCMWIRTYYIINMFINAFFQTEMNFLIALLNQRVQYASFNSISFEIDFAMNDLRMSAFVWAMQIQCSCMSKCIHVTNKYRADGAMDLWTMCARVCVWCVHESDCTPNHICNSSLYFCVIISASGRIFCWIFLYILFVLFGCSFLD